MAELIDKSAVNYRKRECSTTSRRGGRGTDVSASLDAVSSPAVKGVRSDPFLGDRPQEKRDQSRQPRETNARRECSCGTAIVRDASTSILARWSTYYSCDGYLGPWLRLSSPRMKLERAVNASTRSTTDNTSRWSSDPSLFKD